MAQFLKITRNFIKFSFDVALFLNFILIALWHIFSIHIFYIVCVIDELSISEVHYESTLFLEFAIWVRSLEFIAKHIIKKLMILMLNITLHFKFIYNLKKITTMIIQIVP
jgi:hypothetical protein